MLESRQFLNLLAQKVCEGDPEQDTPDLTFILLPHPTSSYRNFSDE